ncbi:hypothetical protein R3P38DRAFT_969991 [Favolaschia claudopus]|uniref:Uncharacterized protein n=1 Tax=Favolaschia claudopus TaxID=2862362 RepID=A0AAW0E7J6_9AGAR
MQTSYTISSTEFAAQWGIATPVLYETAIELFFYMIFFAMFALTMYLYHHNQVAGVKLLWFFTSAMFALGTLHVTLKLVIAVYALRMVRLAVEGSSMLQKTTLIRDRVVFVNYMLLSTNNALTDSLLIFRCYVVWGRNMHITFLPIVMLATTTVLGYVATVQDNFSTHPTVDPKIPFVMSVATNSTLTVLTAGRMWWIGREAGRASTLPAMRSYNSAVVMILESGALYSLTVILFVISYASPSRSATILNNVLTGVLPQMVNLAPSLIAVRVGLSRAVEGWWLDDRSRSANLTFTSVRMRSFAS